MINEIISLEAYSRETYNLFFIIQIKKIIVKFIFTTKFWKKIMIFYLKNVLMRVIKFEMFKKKNV